MWLDGSSVLFDGNGDIAGWTDKSGNGNDAVMVSTTGLSLFDGSDTSNTELYLNGQPLIYGTPDTQMKLGPNLQLSPLHTVFNLCKYRTTGQKRRIIEATGSNSFYGFWNGRSGVAIENGWITSQSNNLGTGWLLSTTTNKLYRGNGVDYTLSSWTGNGASVGYLGINYGSYGNHAVLLERSDFACAEVLVIDGRELSCEDIQCMEQYFIDKYQLGFTPSSTFVHGCSECSVDADCVDNAECTNGECGCLAGYADINGDTSSCVTSAPTLAPSLSPSSAPSTVPSASPSMAPSVPPSIAPSSSPSISPSSSPSLSPSSAPSTSPSASPSAAPSLVPTSVPSSSPSLVPTSSPSMAPSISPSVAPSLDPSSSPSLNPSSSPSLAPSISPSVAPSKAPTGIYIYLK